MHASHKSLWTDAQLKNAWDLILVSKKITLLTHHKPDGDGISACAALSRVFSALGKEIEAVYPSVSEYNYTRESARVHVGMHTQMPDLLIACDTANYDRLYYPEAFKKIPLINIDHHVSNSIQGTINFVDGKASSTCEMVYDLLLTWAPNYITSDVAECILFGMLYDTQVFQSQAVTAKTLRVAADLVERGANLFQLKTELLSDKNPRIISFWGMLMSRITLSPQGNAAWSVVRQRDFVDHGVKPSVLLGFNNFLAQISGVDVTILFYETPDGKTKISLRSKHADVNKLAARFGGGGHTNAAGILSVTPIDQLVQELTDCL